MMASLRSILLLVSFLVVMGFEPSRAKAALIFSLDPQGGVNLSELVVGQTFTVAVDAFGFMSSDQLRTFIVSESFSGPQNFGALRVNSITPGNLISSGVTFKSSSTDTTFSVSLSATPPITTPGTIALISLTALRPGQGLFYPYEYGFTGMAHDSVSFTGLNVSFNVVPEPSSLALCGVAGVIGISIIRSRQRNDNGLVLARPRKDYKDSVLDPQGFHGE